MATYTQLLTDLPVWMENPSQEYIAALPGIIRMSEQKCYRELGVAAMTTVVTGIISAGSFTIPRPSDLIQPMSLRIKVGTRWQILELRAYEFLFEYAPDESVVGKPVYYGVESGDTYRIAPSSDLDYEYRLEYMQYMTPLSVSNEENWLSTVGYDALFSACMVNSGRFVLDDRQTSIIAMWTQNYQEAIMSLNAIDRRSERDNFRVPTRTIRNE